jgi:hypothetical protein
MSSSRLDFNKNRPATTPEIKRASSRDGFGVSTLRFDSSATITPGVGAYNISPEFRSPLSIESPSISKRGYKGSFGSKSPKFEPYHDSGVPGPNAYTLDQFSIGVTGSPRPSSPSPPRSACFSPTTKERGRIPFPDPNPYPGPNAYLIHPHPGISPLLVHKGNATFLSKSKRDSFIQPSATPSPVHYHPYENKLFDPLQSVLGDTQWSKSSYHRFSDLGRDNLVPGPDRYFNPNHNEQYQQEKQQEKSLRTVGNYRGQYLYKHSLKSKQQFSSFGIPKNRFQNSIFSIVDHKSFIQAFGRTTHTIENDHQYAQQHRRSQSLSPIKKRMQNRLQSDFV